MKILMITMIGAVLGLLAMLSAPALTVADDDIKATLRGFEEVPAISTVATGKFRGEIDNDSIEFRLNYENLEGDVTQAHIHFGQKGFNGGIVIFLCTNLGNGPSGTPACPGPHSGTVTGTRRAADVLAVLAQGIAAGQFAEVVRAIRAGIAYANVHSAGAGGVATNFNGGEIRGQIRAEDDD